MISNVRSLERSSPTVSIGARSAAAPAHHTHHSGFLGGVRQSWHASTRTGLAIGKGIGAAVPFLVVLLLLGAAAAGTVRLRCRRRGHRASAAPPRVLNDAANGSYARRMLIERDRPDGVPL